MAPFIQSVDEHKNAQPKKHKQNIYITQRYTKTFESLRGQNKKYALISQANNRQTKAFGLKASADSL